MSKNRLLQGNEVCALACIKAGARFCAGYPITPSSDIMEHLSELLPKVGGKFIQMEDELASMGAIIGASVTGVKSVTTTSGPGFDLMQENLAFAAMAEIPCVVVDVQRSGPSTGGATKPAQGDLMQIKYGRSGDTSVIALYPNSVKEVYKTTIDAFNYAEKYMTPVVILMDETIGHLHESICIDEFEDTEIVSRELPTVPPEEYKPYETDESGIVKLMPFCSKENYSYVINGMHHDEYGMPDTNHPEVIERGIERINGKIERYKEDIWLWDEKETEDAEILIVACGNVSRSAAEAVSMLREKGKKVGLFRPISIWPFPEEPFKKAARSAKKIIVPELNRGQLVHIIRELAGKDTEICSMLQNNGIVIMPEQIADFVEEATK